MNETPRYLTSCWESDLADLIDPSDQRDVMDWLTANHRRRRVVLVGSGFSLNAERLRQVHIPLWADVANALAHDLGVDPRKFDALTLADFFRHQQGDCALQPRLLNLLDDSSLQPGAAHRAIWESDPEAVITTNFLDTLLDKSSRATKVVRDPDLALPYDPRDKTQLIYFHGHRNDFTSWVVGRRDYEDLEARQPMIFARVRQLFAQYPLLVVGYSLTDPDFHFVYRQMVRAMDRRHPLGLAVILPTSDDNQPLSKESRASAAAKKYWEGLGLRIVRFLPSNSVPAQFEQFFRLTKPVREARDIERAYRSVAAPSTTIAKCFEHNLGVLRSALRDPDLDLVWQGRLDRWRLWDSLRARVLTREHMEWAGERARQFNKAEVESRQISDGSISQTAPASAENTPEQSKWLLPCVPAAQGAELWKLFTSLCGNRFIWELTLLLEKGVSRVHLAEWLLIGIKTVEILDHVEASAILLLGALLLGEREDEDVRVIRERCESRFPRLYQVLKDVVLSDKVAPTRSVVDHLLSARRAVQNEDRESARSLYEQAFNAASSSADSDAPLLQFFAAYGWRDVALDEEFGKVDFKKLEDAEARVDRARASRVVSEWERDVSQFELQLKDARIKALEKYVLRGAYESREISFSNTGSSLLAKLLDATRLGLPLSYERELVEALRGAFVSEIDELEERLRLNLRDTGRWLAHSIGSGSLFRRRRGSAHPGPEKVGTDERRATVAQVGDLLFPTNSELNRVEKRARVDVFRSASHILRKKDVVRARDLLAAEPHTAHSMEAWAGLSRVCTWLAIKDEVLSVVMPLQTERLELSRFPWQHWIRCDHFLDHGGAALVDKVCQAQHPVDRMYAAGSLIDMLTADPASVVVVQSCAKYIDVVFNTELADTRDAIVAAHFLALSEPYRTQQRSVEEHVLRLASQREDICRVLAESDNESELRARARQLLIQGSQNDLRSKVLAAAYTPNATPLAVELVKHAIRQRWDELTCLAEVLSPDLWDDWSALVNLLRLGGHQGMTGSWLLARVNLAIRALDDPRFRSALFDDSSTGVGFLRHAIVDGVAYGDDLLANKAVYGLGTLAMHVTNDSDALAVASALDAARDDVRIDVAHGAAFVSAYLDEAAATHPLHPFIAKRAKSVLDDLRHDELAILHRQIAFGVACAQGDATARQR